MVQAGVRLFAYRASSKVLSFIGIAVFSHLIASDQLGAFFLFQSVLGILTLISNFGISTSVEKRISEGKDAGAVISAALLINTLTLSVLAVPIIFGAKYINNFVGAPVATLLLVTVLLYQGQTLVRHYLRGRFNVSSAEALGTLHKFAWVAIGFAFIQFDVFQNKLMLSLSLAWFIALLAGLLIEVPNLEVPTVEMIWSVVDFSWHSFVLSITGFGFIWTDTILIGFFLERSSVAVYEIAWRVASVFSVFGYSLAETTFPSISKWDSEGKIDRISSVVSQSLSLGLVVVIPGFVGAVVLGESLLSVFFGDGYRTGYPVLVVLMLYQIVSIPGMIFTRLIVGMDRPDITSKSGVLSGLLNISLNILLIPIIGIVGASVATTVAFCCNVVLMAGWLSGRIPLRVRYSEFGWCTMSAVIMGVVVHTVEQITPGGGILAVVFLVSVGVSTYFSLLSGYSPLRRRLIAQFRSFADS